MTYCTAASSRVGDVAMMIDASNRRAEGCWSSGLRLDASSSKRERVGVTGDQPKSADDRSHERKSIFILVWVCESSMSSVFAPQSSVRIPHFAFALSHAVDTAGEAPRRLRPSFFPSRPQQNVSRSASRRTPSPRSFSFSPETRVIRAHVSCRLPTWHAPGVLRSWFSFASSRSFITCAFDGLIAEWIG